MVQREPHVSVLGKCWINEGLFWDSEKNNGSREPAKHRGLESTWPFGGVCATPHFHTVLTDDEAPGWGTSTEGGRHQQRRQRRMTQLANGRHHEPPGKGYGVREVHYSALPR